jgi:protein tyrosine phosphatase (PTP) superfamily phosphohydrolase (DUF442 family)
MAKEKTLKLALHDIRKRFFTRTASLLLLLFCLALGASYFFYFTDRFTTVIHDRIYRSAQLSHDHLQNILKEKGIKTIINLRGQREGVQWYDRERETAEKNGVRLFDFKLSPHTLPEADVLSSLLTVLFQAERPLLIHCLRGAERTGFVSALALSVENDSPLQELKKHISLRFGILPLYRSVGSIFFHQYEEWLRETDREHNREHLIYWIKNEYVDGKGNLKYWIQAINNRTLDSDERVFLTGKPKKISIHGWAYDYRSKTPVDELHIVLDNNISSPAIYKYNRPDVASFYQFGESIVDNFVIGWEAKFNVDSLSRGCHRVFLKHIKNRTLIWNFSTEYEFCIDS